MYQTEVKFEQCMMLLSAPHLHSTLFAPSSAKVVANTAGRLLTALSTTWQEIMAIKDQLSKENLQQLKSLSFQLSAFLGVPD